MFPTRMFASGSISVRALFAGIFALGGLCGLSPHASANDGGISMGGTPRLLSGHPSVSMTSEVINIVVDKDKQKNQYTVDCRFVFTNTGPACAVRMGFPDEGEDAYDPDEEEDAKEALRKPPRTTFTSFRSYINGHPAATKLVRGSEEGHYWHTKMVQFPAHSVLRIRDVYTQRVGGGIISFDGGKSGSASQIAYILHTGSSWRGTIGRSEINVTFAPATFAHAPRLIPLNQAAKTTDARELRVKFIAPDAVIWEGPGAPTAQGNTLRFVRANWRPTARDDLKLTYGFQGVKTD